MSPHSPAPVPRTTSSIPQSSQPSTYQNLHLTFTLSLHTLLRFITTVFALIAIITLLVGQATQRSYYYHHPNNGFVAFPLIFLFFSFLSHVAAGAHHLFTELIYVEWRRPDWRMQDPSLWRLPERWQYLRRPEARTLAVADGCAGIGIGVGTLLVVILVGKIPTLVAGIVFAFLTAAIHIVLAVVPAGGYLLTLTFWEGDQERKLRDGDVQSREEVDGEAIDLKAMV